ncbi:MAG: DUF167 domain-containing protein [Actinobacteria bacterium]|nr:DUF167 domain-containing protein [Actinomycetota bacterium]
MKTETIKLIVKPNSTAAGVYGIYMDRIKIKLAAVPEKGKANKELIKFISGKTGIPKKNIKIIAGEKSIYKEISIKSDKDLNLTSRLLSS